jgi:GTP-binding protein
MKMKKVVIIGRPNVGKSSLFNRIVGKKTAIIHDVAGTTRDVISDTVVRGDKAFLIFDTAGYQKEKGSLLSEAALRKVKEAVDSSDLLILVVDGNVAPTNEDVQIADIARKSGKEVVLAVNKLDNAKEGCLSDYRRLGFKEIFPMSVIHNIGVADLLVKMPKGEKEEMTEPDNEEVKISICGRPNVGKSSILNAMLKKERALVSEIPGTTRDVVSEIAELGGVSFKLSDTAGARKPGKIGKAYKKGEPIEKYSYLRTQREVEGSDIVLVVLDASDKIAAQDLHIAGKAKELGKGIVLLINKWDLMKDTDQNKFLARLLHEFNFMVWVPAIFVSAKSGRNIEEIIGVIKEVRANQTRTVATSKLNRILEDFVLTNRPQGLGSFRPKMFFIAQTGTVPPTFSITAKFHAFVHFAWRRALENELRRHFDFAGTPVKIEFKGKRE